MRYRLCSKVQHIYTNNLSTVYYQHTTYARRLRRIGIINHAVRSCIHTGESVNRTQPKRHRHILIGPNTKNIRRQQHAQAVAEKDYSHEDPTTEQRDGQCANTVKFTHGHISSPENGDVSYGENSHTTHANTKATDHMLRIVGKFLPYTTPNVRVFEDLNQGHEDGTQDGEEVIRIELINEEHKISCAGTVKILETSQDSLEQLFEQLAQKYMHEVELRLGLSKSPDQDTRAYSTQTLYETLELGTVSVDIAPVELKSIHTQSLELFRAQVYSGHEPIGQPQTWTNPGIAQRLARASADLEVLKRAEQAGIEVIPTRLPHDNEPTARKKKRSLKLERVKDPSKIQKYEASISLECLDAMLFTLRKARIDGLPDEVQLESWQGAPSSDQPEQTGEANRDKVAAKIKQEYMQKRVHSLRAIEREQSKLPIRKPLVVRQICHAVQQNDVLLLISETGSGKTTQLPQILLQEALLAGRGTACNIICTQPRRIAATSVATRVAYEHGTHVGGSVGYHVRFDRRLPNQQGSINYSTAGVLLKRLQDESAKILDETSHIVVDEVHERDLTVDLLIALLRDLMRVRRASGKSFPKLILMSATMVSMDFEQYFAESWVDFTPRVTSIRIPGRTYPVSVNMLDDIIPQLVDQYANDKQVTGLLRDSQQYLEWEDEFAASRDKLDPKSFASANSSVEQATGIVQSSNYGNPFRDATMPYQLITLTVIHALRNSEKGDILIFLPGMKEIDVLANMLLTRMPADLDFTDSEKLRVFKLHSALYESNAKVFAPVPTNCRRVILATNIAQTSITLPGVVHVIDTGKRRNMAYDPVSRKNEFSSTWIDQATSMQRRGRAGRVQNGHYWAMFTDARYRSMPKQAQPEMLTSDLTGPSLTLKSHSTDVDLQSFFDRALDPPGRQAVAACIQELQELGMLTSDEQITPLGKFCSEFPLHPAKARGLLLGLLFGCFKPLMIVASHNADSPLIHSAANRRDMYYSALGFAGVSDDDRYAVVEAFLQYDQAMRSGSTEDVASLENKHIKAEAYRNMCSVGRQLYETMAEYGLLPHSDAGSAMQKESVFALIPSEADVNAHKVNLFKALALSVVDTNLAVWNETEQSWLVKDLKCMLKPYSVNTMQSLRLLHRMPYRMQGELIGFGGMVRNVITSPRPFLIETSSITPIMAMLFGGPIVLVDNDTIEIDGWLRYSVKVESARLDKSDSHENEVAPAKVIFEFRKAIDRFLTIAFSELRHKSLETSVAVSPLTVLSKKSILRDVMSKGLIAVLEADAQHWDEVTHLT